MTQTLARISRDATHKGAKKKRGVCRAFQAAKLFTVARCWFRVSDLTEPVY